jgi:hypothetical protein
VNFISHCLHSNGFSPVWIMLCIFRYPRCVGIHAVQRSYRTVRTLLEIRVLQGFFTNTYNKTLPYRVFHAVKNP